MYTTSEVNNEKAAASNDASSPEAGASESVRSDGGLRSRKANAALSSKSPMRDADDELEGGTAYDGTPPASEAQFAGKGGTPWSQRSFAYQFMPFRGMYYDVVGRMPYYVDDWVEGFRPKNLYRVVAASLRMYFIK